MPIVKDLYGIPLPGTAAGAGAAAGLTAVFGCGVLTAVC
jgi:hypothetical protein